MRTQAVLCPQGPSMWQTTIYEDNKNDQGDWPAYNQLEIVCPILIKPLVRNRQDLVDLINGNHINCRLASLRLVYVCIFFTSKNINKDKVLAISGINDARCGRRLGVRIQLRQKIPYKEEGHRQRASSPLAQKARGWTTRMRYPRSLPDAPTGRRCKMSLEHLSPWS